MTVAVNGRSRVEEGGGGEEGRGRQRYLERLFGVRSEGIERGSREEISRERLLPVRSRLRNNRRILCSFHESGRKGTRRVADNSVSEPRSPLSPPSFLLCLLFLLLLLLLFLFPHAAPSLQPSYFLQPL